MGGGIKRGTAKGIAVGKRDNLCSCSLSEGIGWNPEGDRLINLFLSEIRKPRGIGLVKNAAAAAGKAGLTRWKRGTQCQPLKQRIRAR